MKPFWLLNTLLRLLAATVIAVLAQAAEAATSAGGPLQEPPHGPPPEAVAACQGKTAGTTASFTDRGGRTVTGACTKIGNVLAVASQGPPPGAPPSGASAPR